MHRSERASTGYAGVRRTASGAFWASCTENGTVTYLGSFPTAELAATAYARHVGPEGPSGAGPVADSVRDEFVPTPEELRELTELGHPNLKLWRRTGNQAGSVAKGGSGFAGVSRRKNDKKASKPYWQAISERVASAYVHGQVP